MLRALKFIVRVRGVTRIETLRLDWWENTLYLH